MQRPLPDHGKIRDQRSHDRFFFNTADEVVVGRIGFNDDGSTGLTTVIDEGIDLITAQVIVCFVVSSSKTFFVRDQECTQIAEDIIPDGLKVGDDLRECCIPGFDFINERIDRKTGHLSFELFK